MLTLPLNPRFMRKLNSYFSSHWSNRSLESTQQHVIKWIAPTALVLAAVRMQFAFWEVGGNEPYLFLYPAVFLGSLFGNRAANLLATTIAAAAAWFFFVPPPNTFFGKDPVEYFGVCLFAASGIVASILGARVSKTRIDLQALEDAKNAEEILSARISGRTREAEASRRQAEAASEAKTAFFANMSHEIRTPLGAILGFAQLIRDDGASEELRRSGIETILRNGEQLHRLINELLDISKAEVNHFEVDRASFDLLKLIRDVTALLSVKAEQKGLEFQVRSDGKLPSRVFTDSARLRQILMNIIGNAIKFTSKGSVDVTFRILPPDLFVNSYELEILVSDSGIGIPDDKIDALFQPFMQADSTTARAFGGTGLGLYLSRKLAQSLGGDIRLIRHSTGSGCTFVIRIDAGLPPDQSPDDSWEFTHAPSPKTAVDAPGAPAERIDGVEVLVVDDSEDNLILTRLFLSAAGAKVTCALGAEKAFNAVSGQSFDVILMDIQMPGTDGYQAVTRLRKSGYAKPIVALTAHAMKGERERCLAVGFDGFLNKPIDRQALIGEVGKMAQSPPLRQRQ